MRVGQREEPAALVVNDASVSESNEKPEERKTSRVSRRGVFLDVGLKLEMIEKISRLMSEGMDVPSVFRAAAVDLCESFDAHLVVIYIVDDEDGGKEKAVAYEDTGRTSKLQKRACERKARRAIKGRKIIVEPGDGSAGRGGRGGTPTTVIAAPIIYKNESLGALAILVSDMTELDSEDRFFIGVFVNEMAIALNSLKVNEKLIEAELSFERAAREAITRAAGDGIFVINKDMIIQVYNNALEKITGFTSDKIVGIGKCYEVIGCSVDGESLCEDHCPFKTIQEDQPHYRTMEMNIAHREYNGRGKRRVRVEMTYSAVMNQDKFRTGIAVVRDMPELRVTREEMRIAREIQRGLLPEKPPVIDGHDISFICQPAMQVGGDCLDFIPMSDGRMGIAISDIAGKHLPAALLVSMNKGLLRSLATKAGSVQSPLEELNERILADTSPEVFITMIYGIYDPRRTVFTYANVGHVPPILLHAGKCTLLQPPQPPLGVIHNLIPEQRVVKLFKGDTLILLSDGVLDARNAEGVFFGMRRLCRIIERHPTLTAEKLCTIIYKRARQFASQRLQDDFTLMVLKCNHQVEATQMTEIIVENRPASIKDSRSFIMSAAGRMLFSSEELSDIEIAVGEALTNAVQHGQSPDEDNNRLKINCEVADEYFEVRITDNGMGFATDLDSWNPPRTSQARGRGIYLMKALTDHVRYEILSRGTAVVLVKNNTPKIR